MLVIEDDQRIREALANGLASAGHAVRTEGSGAAALTAVVDWRPEVVVLDLGLPDLDGTDVLRMLRGVSEVPVIVATARDDEADIVRLLDQGADDYVVKPYSAAQLEARIRAVLRRGGAGDDGDDRLQVGGCQEIRPARIAQVEGGVLEDRLQVAEARAGRELEGAGAAGADYMQISSGGATGDRLVGASSPVAGRAELQTNITEGDIMGRRPGGSIEIEPGKPVGMAIVEASRKVVEKARVLAAHQLECDVSDVEFSDGRFSVRGSPDAAKTIQELAFASFTAHDLPGGESPVLTGEAVFDPEVFSYPHGTHLALVEVDTETGAVHLAKYVAVDDVGKVVNPMVVEGQVHGGVVQGIAQALFEEAIYDEDGNLVTGTFVDYLVPSAADVPSITTDRTETPATTNPLGVKGVGEAGTTGALAAVTLEQGLRDRHPQRRGRLMAAVKHLQPQRVPPDRRRDPARGQPATAVGQRQRLPHPQPAHRRGMPPLRAVEHEVRTGRQLLDEEHGRLAGGHR